MRPNEKYKFVAEIYQTGINRCVDVPFEITNCLNIEKGRINIFGKINGFVFTKTLMPVKNTTHRLFVNRAMVVGAKTALGEMAAFEIEQNYNVEIKEYPIPSLLTEHLVSNNLTREFLNLTASKKKAILKYFSYVKTGKTFLRNVNKLIIQLRNNDKNVRMP